MRDTPAVQLADLCAWGYHRKLMKIKHGKEGKYAHLADIAEKILPTDRKPIDEQGLSLLAFFNETYPTFFSDQGFLK